MPDTSRPSRRLLLHALICGAVLSLCSCVSTPAGSKFDPMEGARRADKKIDDFLTDLGYGGLTTTETR